MPGPSSATSSLAAPPHARTDTLTWVAACRTALSSRFTTSRLSASGSPLTMTGAGASAATGTRAAP